MSNKIQLFRTTCSIDHKNRPCHVLKFVAAHEDRAFLVEQMDADVRSWMSSDVATWRDEAAQEEGRDPAKIQVLAAHAARLAQDPDLYKLWMKEWTVDPNWEMSRKDKSEPRSFVESDEGDTTTIVYHFFVDELSSEKAERNAVYSDKA